MILHVHEVLFAAYSSPSLSPPLSSPPGPSSPPRLRFLVTLSFLIRLKSLLWMLVTMSPWCGSKSARQLKEGWRFFGRNEGRAKSCATT